jgi:hypothetical protein
MQTTSTPTIVVTGATGQQGGAVVKSLRRSFHVKAITRDPKKPEAQALTKLGVEVQHAKCWLKLPGVPAFQPGQLAVAGGILTIALFLSYARNWHASLRILCTGIIAAPAMVLILKQPDLGMTIAWAPVMLTMLYLAGLPLRWLAVVLLTGLTVPSVLTVDRITRWFSTLTAITSLLWVMQGNVLEGSRITIPEIKAAFLARSGDEDLTAGIRWSGGKDAIIQACLLSLGPNLDPMDALPLQQLLWLRHPHHRLNTEQSLRGGFVRRNLLEGSPSTAVGSW